MEHNEISTVSRQLKRTLGERTLNDLGRATRLCRRERAITPFRLAVSLIESFAGALVGRTAVVRNGYQPARDIQTGIGPVTVKVPKIRSRDGKPVSFHSALVPPYVRKTASLEAALPWLYLKGISTGEMQPVLEVLLGAEAKGLSASTVSRLKQTWRQEYESWRRRCLGHARWGYIWADGIYSGLRADRQRLWW